MVEEARVKIPRRLVLSALGVLSCISIGACTGGETSDTPAIAGGPPFGHPDSVLFWTPEQQLAGFPNYDQIFDTRALAPSADPFPLPSRPTDFSELQYEVDGTSYSLEDFLTHNRVAGLLVLDGGEIVLEEYRMGHEPDVPWVSYSVTKSVVSLLIGAAIRDGHIQGVDDRVAEYLPELQGTGYEGVSIAHLLQMASGVEWDEDYTDPGADVSREIGMTNSERLSYIGSKPRVDEPGARFNYNTGETHLAGAVLRAAIDGDLADYLAATVWQPFGMEHDANWRLVESDGAEHGGCCISATLRDFGRIGMFALREGVLRNGEQVLPVDWMTESTSPSTGNPGYGNLWWLGEGSSYSARGIFGQGIFVDPSDETVIATQGAWPEPTGREFSAHRDAFFAAMKRFLEKP